jgi:transposase
MREVINGIFFVLRGGIRWRMLPRALSAAPNGVPLVHAFS